MAKKSGIEWTDATFNPWIGCTKISPLGCANCYAEADFDKRRHVVKWGAGQPRHRTKTWGDPVRWNKQADAFFAEHGRRQRVFCASLADVFDNEVSPEWRTDLFELIANTPNLDWLILTKRIGNARSMLDEVTPDTAPHPCSFSEAYPNVWLGATVVNQAEADRDIPKLLAVPAAKRFLSMEPLLGPVDITEHLWGRAKPCAGCTEDIDCGCGMNPRGCVPDEPALDWVIVGGESAANARPMHPDWVRSLRDQCQPAGVPFFFKQWGEWLPYDYLDAETKASTKSKDWQRAHGSDFDRGMVRIGKKAAGRLLDGALHDGYPASACLEKV